MNEKRVLLAALLSSIFLAWYAQSVMKWQRQAKTPARQGLAVPGQPVLTSGSDESWPPLPAHEEMAIIESPMLQVEVGRSTAAVRRVRLKEFQSQDAKQPLELAASLPLFQAKLPGKELHWRYLPSSSSQEALFESEKYNISYTLDQINPLVIIKLQQISDSEVGRLELLQAWTKADSLSNRQNRLEIILLKNNNNAKMSYERRYPTQKNWTNVSRGTFIASLSERYFCQSVKTEKGSLAVRRLPAPEGIAAIVSQIEAEPSAEHQLIAYVGARDYFRMKRAGFEKAFPIGTLGQIGLILLTVLGWIAGIVKNYGIAIILFSVLITSAMAPMSLMGFRSMKKMQELKPKVDRLMAQHKDDPKRANQEIFSLYREHRVSPMSGCLPMMLQIPIFMAMFNAISHFIQLRGQSFLWIRDLSQPDRIAHLPISLPIFGSDINLLPLIMAGAMFLQTKMSQGNVKPDPSNPSASMMSSPLMSVMFGVMFYQFPAGLVLYWLTNSLTSLAYYRAAGMARNA